MDASLAAAVLSLAASTGALLAATAAIIAEKRSRSVVEEKLDRQIRLNRARLG